ncbi:MAG: hypothetical protein ACRD44_19385, partial [Bryobacteraceae bacterium]
MRLAVLLWSAALLADGPVYRPAGYLSFPAGEEIGAMSAVAIGPQDQIYVLHRGPKPLMAFDAHGRFRKSWGQGLFRVPHGLRVDRGGGIWATDNALNVVRKFAPDGKLLATFGESGDVSFRAPDDLV